MATQTLQAGPSQRARTPSGDSGRSTAIPTRGVGATKQEDISGYEEDESEYESEEEIPYKGKGKGVAAQAAPRPQMQSPPSASSQRERSSTSWADLDLSIIVACVSPIGNWLTGGDHIKNLFLIILLIFYLHQLIEVPWRLYQASRPRKSPGSRTGEPDRVTKLAETELRRQELFLLLVTSVTPLLGATFLKHVLSALGERESLSWFSTTLFVLATGIRPWTHLLGRIQGHTEALHDAVHYPPEKTDAADANASAALLNRIDALEEEVRELSVRAALAERLQEVCDDLSEALGELERDSKRSGRKADAARLALAARMAVLEKGLVQIEQNRRMDVDALRRGYVSPLYERVCLRAWAWACTAVAAVLRLPRTIWNLGAPEVAPNMQSSGGSPVPLPEPVAPRGVPARGTNSNAHHRLSSSGAPDLPTIPESTAPEEEDDAHGEADADSDGTYVSEEQDPTANGSASTSKTRRVRSGSRSRSRSSSGGSSSRKCIGTAKPASFHQWVFALVQAIVLWPYRASVRILLTVAPPLGSVLPKLGV